MFALKRCEPCYRKEVDRLRSKRWGQVAGARAKHDPRGQPIDRSRLVELIQEAGPDGISIAELRNAMGHSVEHLRAYLRREDAFEERRHGRRRRWLMAEETA